MKQRKISLSQKEKESKDEVAKILAKFYKESSAIVNAAIKESHRKYPKLFKSS